MDFIAEGFIQAFRMLLTMDEETTVIVVTTFKLTGRASCSSAFPRAFCSDTSTFPESAPCAP